MDKWLKKLGIKFEDLNQEEKDTYYEWEKAISGRKLTDKDVIKWLEEEKEIAVSRITDIDLSEEDELFRKMEVKFIKKVLNFLNSPIVEKEFAQKAIEQLIKK